METDSSMESGAATESSSGQMVKGRCASAVGQAMADRGRQNYFDETEAGSTATGPPRLPSSRTFVERATVRGRHVKAALTVGRRLADPGGGLLGLPGGDGRRDLSPTTDQRNRPDDLG